MNRRNLFKSVIGALLAPLAAPFAKFYTTDRSNPVRKFEPLSGEYRWSYTHYEHELALNTVLVTEHQPFQAIARARPDDDQSPSSTA